MEVLPTSMGKCAQEVLRYNDILKAVCFFRTSVIHVQARGVLCDPLYLDGKSFRSFNMNVVCSEGWKSIDDYRCVQESTTDGISVRKMVIRDTGWVRPTASSSAATGEPIVLLHAYLSIKRAFSGSKVHAGCCCHSNQGFRTYTVNCLGEHIIQVFYCSQIHAGCCCHSNQGFYTYMVNCCWETLYKYITSICSMLYVL